MSASVSGNPDARSRWSAMQGARVRRIAPAALALIIGAWASVAYVAAPAADTHKYEQQRLTRNAKYFAPPAYRNELRGGPVMVTFLGTTTLLFDDGKTQFLIDGFLTRPRLLSSIRVQTNKRRVREILEQAGVDQRKLQAVFVSHSHYDHAMDVAYIAQHYRSTILYGSLSTQNIGRGADIPPERNRLFHAGEEIPVGPQEDPDNRFSVTVLDSRHSTPTLFPGYIERPLRQPTGNWHYREGGSYDFLVRHGTHTILVRAGSNLLPARADLKDTRVEVIFLGVGRLGKENEDFRRLYFQQTVARLCPELVVPMHWDNFFRDLKHELRFAPRLLDNPAPAFDSLLWQIGELNASGGCPKPVEFGILQGFESVALFRQPPQTSSP